MSRTHTVCDEIYELELLTKTNSTKTTMFRVKIIGTGRCFNQSLDKLYTKEYLDRLSKEDCCYLAYLFFSIMENVKGGTTFPIKKLYVHNKYLPFISIAFSIFFILSNLAGTKISLLFGYSIASGVIFFPITFIFDDVITEVYGYKKSRIVIWTALIANIVFLAGVHIVIALPPNTQVWELQEQFREVFSMTPRIFLASCVAYLLGEFINSYTIAKMKIISQGMYFELRAVVSTILGIAVENIIFCSIAFFGLLPTSVILEMILTLFCFKLIYEIIMLPITKRIVIFLKKKERIDYYDNHTNFNPFSLKDE